MIFDVPQWDDGDILIPATHWLWQAGPHGNLWIAVDTDVTDIGVFIGDPPPEECPEQPVYMITDTPPDGVMIWMSEDGREERNVTDPATDTDDVVPGTEDMEVGICRRCGRNIIWEFDNNTEPFGFWFDAEHGTEACIPGANDEDRYHTPREGDED